METDGGDGSEMGPVTEEEQNIEDKRHPGQKKERNNNNKNI